MTIDIRTATPSDYDGIAEVMDAWWGRPVLVILPRLFLEHFYPSSLTAADRAGLAGFLVGFRSPAQPDRGYIHAVGVRPDLRADGLGRQLYERFFELARAAGCRRVNAVTSPENSGSVAFHRRLGFTVDGPVADYHGPGRDRIVFERQL
jgi:ribosomal protein S18 acetylase RimI-like enzyme